ncbi:uncharacterized protein LOC124920252 isoform X2 [Impatiens glandulifera]|uniref:uncharacterized protein LOC124920252 isoform X2 n=1 Tax=Impatiens glandulifera TaxID=253017 RepID=UPI001FB07A5C|nr:uncharacterized protein LOC124920252 isoform X2 [Impatiens glandulifera]
MENIKKETIGLDYWYQWQVPVCALIIVIPLIIAIRLIRKGNGLPLISSDLWIPSWRNLNPVFLLLFRASALISMSFTLYLTYLRLGRVFVFYFYTQWTFTLVTIYFALVTVISARGCFVYSKTSVPEIEDGEEISSRGKRRSIMKMKADFLEQFTQAIYQICGGASMLTDIVFWGLLVPFMLDEKFKLTMLISAMHSMNVVLLIIDSALNRQPFTWFGLNYFIVLSVTYVIFQWVLHACGFTWWPYPFLELATPWAPLWYLALALVHLPCYGIYILLNKAMVTIFSKMFPKAYELR